MYGIEDQGSNDGGVSEVWAEWTGRVETEQYNLAVQRGDQPSAARRSCPDVRQLAGQQVQPVIAMDMELTLGPSDVVYLDDAGQLVIEHDESGPGWDEEAVMACPPGGLMPTCLESLENNDRPTRVWAPGHP